MGPALHVWYGAIGRMFASGGTSAALKQLALDQGLFGPAFVGLFMSTLMTLVCILVEGLPGDAERRGEGEKRIAGERCLVFNRS